MRCSNKFGFYELNPFPGCNQMVVSNHAFVYPEYRGKGRGHQTHKERLLHATRLGYNYIICTVVGTNVPQIKILMKHGWTQLDGFFNKETGNPVQIWGKRL